MKYFSLTMSMRRVAAWLNEHPAARLVGMFPTAAPDDPQAAFLLLQADAETMRACLEPAALRPACEAPPVNSVPYEG
jgi:hypothetical protein